MSDIITGLDLGSSQVKCLVAEKQKNGTLCVISAFKQPSVGFRRGVLIDPEDAGGMLRELISELKQISKSAAKNIFVNLNSQHIKVRISRGIAAVSQPDKEIKQEDIDRAVQSSRAAKILPNYKVLHTIVREFFVDDVGDIQMPISMSGSRLEVSTLLVEAFAPHFDILVKTLHNAGASVSGIIFNPFAVSSAVLTKRQKELGVLLLDLGAGSSSFIVYEENKPLYAKSVPIGSDHITHDIAIGLKINVDHAEKLKRAFGSAVLKGVSRRDQIKLSEVDPNLTDEVSRRFLSEIIETRVAEIIDIINNEFKPLKNRFQFPAGVVLTGGGVKLDGIADLVKHGLKLPVQIGLPKMNDLEIANPTHETLIDDPEFSAAIGLVMLCRDEGKNRSLNMLDSFRKVLKNLIP